MFGSTVGFSETVDRMDRLPVAPKPRPPSWKISNGHISGTGRPIDFVFHPRAGFSGTADRWTDFWLHQIQDGGWPPFWKILNGHISATDNRIRFIFGSRIGFSRLANQMALLPVGPNPRSWPSAVLHNFEWPYL